MTRNRHLHIGKFLYSLRDFLIGAIYATGVLERQGYASTSEVKNSFNRNASIYDLTRFSWSYGYLGKQEKDAILPYLSEGLVLEIGTGTGRVAVQLAGRYDYVGIDISSQVLKLAKDKVAKKGLEISLAVMDAHQLGVRENAFESVLVSRTIKYLVDPPSMLCEAFRILKNGGMCIISCETGDSIWQRIRRGKTSGVGSDIRFRARDIIDLIQKAGFEVLTLKPIYSLFAPYYGSYLLVRILDKILKPVRIGAWVFVARKPATRKKLLQGKTWDNGKARPERGQIC